MVKREELLEQFGALIRQRRVEDGRSQEDLAAAIGITQPSLSAYECGTALPTLRSLLGLVRELGLNLETLLALLPEGNGEAA